MPELMKQISFGKLDEGMEMPHLLDIQTRAFEALLQLDAASHDREDVGLESGGNVRRRAGEPVGVARDACGRVVRGNRQFSVRAGEHVVHDIADRNGLAVDRHADDYGQWVERSADGRGEHRQPCQRQ